MKTVLHYVEFVLQSARNVLFSAMSVTVGSMHHVLPWHRPNYRNGAAMTWNSSAHAVWQAIPLWNHFPSKNLYKGWPKLGQRERDIQKHRYNEKALLRQYNIHLPSKYSLNYSNFETDNISQEILHKHQPSLICAHRPKQTGADRSCLYRAVSKAC